MSGYLEIAISYFVMKRRLISAECQLCIGVLLLVKSPKQFLYNKPQIGPNRNGQATVGCQVSCGKYPGSYSLASGYPGEYIHDQPAASANEKYI